MAKSNLNQKSISGETLKNINLFWIGFSIYTIGFIYPAIINQPNFIIFNAIQIVGLLLFLFAAFRIICYKFDNTYLRQVFTVYLIWVIIVITRGLSFNYEFLKGTLLDPFEGIFLYLTPLILIFPLKLQNIKSGFKVILVFGFTFLGFIITYHRRLSVIGSDDARGLIEYLFKTFGVASGFILLTYTYHTKKYIITSFFVIILCTLLAIAHARRGLAFTSITILIFFLIILIHNNKKNFNTLFLIICMSPFLFFTFFTYVGTQNKFFNYMKDRKNDDTRSAVELYFFADMKDVDWIVGRGISGLIAAPYDADGDNDKTPGYRTGIETDYLNIILKGGIISLGLMMLISIPAIVLGFFYSKNTLSKASAFWITLWIFDLYPTTVTTFTLNYLLVWISIGICYSPNIRNMLEIELKEYFKQR